MSARRSPRRCRRPASSKATRLARSARASRWRRCDGTDRGIEGGRGGPTRGYGRPIAALGNHKAIAATLVHRLQYTFLSIIELSTEPRAVSKIDELLSRAAHA